jgi:DNA-binding NarL/FixJ family response regulator
MGNSSLTSPDRIAIILLNRAGEVVDESGAARLARESAASVPRALASHRRGSRLRLGPGETFQPVTVKLRDHVVVLFISPNQGLLTDDILGSLTTREREIAHLTAIGEGNRFIAIALGISPITVKWHLKRIYQKTCSGNRNGLMALMLRGRIDLAQEGVAGSA